MKYKLTFLLILALVVVSFAQTFGKIKGMVKNEHGDPLPGTFITVEGTTMGTQADENGYYYIIGIRAGTYNLKCQFNGFKISSKKDIHVKVGLTATVDFKLQVESSIHSQNKKHDLAQTSVACHKINLSNGKVFEIFPRNIGDYSTNISIAARLFGFYILFRL